jgi:hypothetical protein
MAELNSPAWFRGSPGTARSEALAAEALAAERNDEAAEDAGGDSGDGELSPGERRRRARRDIRVAEVDVAPPMETRG